MKMKAVGAAMAAAAAMTASGVVAAPPASATAHDDALLIAKMDTEYQLAVERNDWQTMDRILHKDFALVLGDGRTFDRADLLESARGRKFQYEKQVEMPGTQKVRMYSPDTAVVTALLWLKGTRTDEKSVRVPFDYRLWFTDTYVRTVEGWKYAFGQASLRLP